MIDPATRFPVQCRETRSPARALILLAALALATCPASSPANPLPGYFGAGFHISPSWTLDCGADPVTACDQIGQYCPDLGALALDVYLYPLDEPGFTVQDLWIHLEWNSDWSFDGDFESCVGGSPVTEPVPNGARIHLVLPEPLPIDSDPVRLGRLGLVAWSPGKLTSSTFVVADGLPCMSLPSTVGGPCYSIFDCANWYIVCNTSFNPTTLLLTVEEGSQTSGTVNAWFDGSCPTSFVEDAPWMSLSVAWVDPQTRRITVNVDATGLAPGVHEAPIIGFTEETHACSTVRLTVTPAAQSAPDETPGEERLTTWGQVKTSYR